MTPSRDELLALARQYWRPDKEYNFRLENSPENERFQDLWDEAMQRMDEWWALVRDLKKDLPDFTLGNITATSDSCFRCGVYAPRVGPYDRSPWVVVGCMSIMAPLYTVFGVSLERDSSGKRIHDEAIFDPLPPEMRPAAEAIARRIEGRFGVSPLPLEVAMTPIPLFVEPQEPPDTTLFHALFTAEPGNVP
jgi:hypothetical protein